MAECTVVIKLGSPFIRPNMAEANQKQNLIGFKALQLANEQRSTYGQRYNDYNRYRKHCAARTHRLRSSLKMTHGKGRDFKKLPTVSPENVKDKYLELLLLEAERAWAYSQELITSSSQPANKSKASTIAHSATGRFRRSVHWATQLLSSCQTLFVSSRLSAENLVQVTAYSLVLKGRFLRYRDNFHDALIQLCVARSLLDELAITASSSRDQALATFFSDEIAPEIRHCAHELGRAKAYEISSIVASIAPIHKAEIVDGFDTLVEKLRLEAEAETKAASRRKLNTLMWEGQPVPVRNPELVDVLLKVQEAETKLKSQDAAVGPSIPPENDKNQRSVNAHGSKKGIAAYNTVLLALSDAEEAARRLTEAQQISDSNAGRSIAGSRDIHFVYAYIVYRLLSRRIERDRLLISALLSSQEVLSARVAATSRTLKPQAEQVDGRLHPAVVKLLDSVLQSLNQMRSLSIVDESPDLTSAVDARISFTKALRCVHLTRCYALVHKYAEALTLIQYANLHLRETRSTISLSDSDPITSGEPAFYPFSTTSVDELESDLTTLSLQFKKDWLAYNGGSANPNGGPLRKPLFFDIALNYVQLEVDSLEGRAGRRPEAMASVPLDASSKAEKKPTAKAMEEVRPATPEHQPVARGGLSSLLGGWWGRS